MEPNDNGKTASIISYFSLIGWLIAYFAMYKDNKTALASYHLRQTLLFYIVCAVIWVALSVLTGILVLSAGFLPILYLFDIVYLGMFIVWLIGLIAAINGQEKPIPVIGEKAQTVFSTI